MRVAVYIGTILGIFFCGCSSESGDFALIDVGYSLVSGSELESVVPERYSPGSQVAILTTFECRYSGCGHVEVYGHGGGSDVGILRAPVDAAIGFTQFDITIPGGRLEIPLVVDMTTDLASPMITIVVAYDSLLVDGTMVEWTSPEGSLLYREDLPEDCAFIINRESLDVSIPRVESRTIPIAAETLAVVFADNETDRAIRVRSLGSVKSSEADPTDRWSRWIGLVTPLACARVAPSPPTAQR